ncbi:hemolysin [Pseudomonas gingeri]|uniref:hemolysin n=1 Tax=Pseudomonas gingeri TaxID=117681 RepID=UPI0015A18F25|nr:hemolysin [Pseudomonas gingeri]NWA01652.1 hemolysin [Pseudomonas gingeri]NWA13545.1 hemolysin [Pseudomonas gingeri]NWA53095.1 hemolysin [Pseudomonas gingeri]NWA96592.1 hemolysin [Pseudomonas gingeri]NWA99771.1 hemolysin [Pseudomonas gingeri]
MDIQNRTSNDKPSAAISIDQDVANTAGTHDLEFGEHRDGLVIFSEAGPGFIGPSVLQRDGRHFFIGVHESSSTSLMQADFAAEGFYYDHFTSPLPGSSRALVNTVLDSEEKFIVLGNFRADEQAFCTRLTATGEADPTFGEQGEFILPYKAPWTGYGRRLALQTDGHIVLLLRTDEMGRPDRGVIVRLTPDGGFDPGFGTCGVVTAPEPGLTFEAVRLQADGKLVIAGRRGRRAVLMRYGTTGLPDKAFGCTGYLELEPATEGSAALFDLAIQADQKIVAVGSADLAQQVALLIRVTPEGTPDPLFNGGTPWAYPGLGLCFATAIQEDGKIVSAGHKDNGGHTWLMRHLDNGEPDRNFGERGLSRVNSIPGDTSYLSHLELQPDGKILISGRYATHSAIIRCHGR